VLLTTNRTAQCTVEAEGSLETPKVFGDKVFAVGSSWVKIGQT
jgi:hypothetical protein